MWTSEKRVVNDSATYRRLKVWTYTTGRRWRVAPDVLLGGVQVWDRSNLGRGPRRFSSLGYAFAAIELAEAVDA